MHFLTKKLPYVCAMINIIHISQERLIDARITKYVPKLKTFPGQCRYSQPPNCFVEELFTLTKRSGYSIQ